jgi:hypothetical protein
MAVVVAEVPCEVAEPADGTVTDAAKTVGSQEAVVGVAEFAFVCVKMQAGAHNTHDAAIPDKPRTHLPPDLAWPLFGRPALRSA